MQRAELLALSYSSCLLVCAMEYTTNTGFVAFFISSYTVINTELDDSD